MTRHTLGVSLAIMLFWSALPVAAQEAASKTTKRRVQAVVHAAAGELKKVDSAMKTIAIKTAKGGEEAFKFTERTTVTGLEKGAKATSLAGKEGAEVVIHYTGEGAEKTAVAIEHIGREVVSVVEGSIVRVDSASRAVVVKTKEGAEETFHIGERATIDTAKGIRRSITSAGKEGAGVTVHYTTSAGRKIVHLLRHL